MPTLEPHLYIDLGSDYIGWKDITADVLIESPIRWAQGIVSNDARDRLANTGQFSIHLDNSSDNDAGVAGYYSPGHSDCLAGFEIGRRIRWQYETPEGQDPSFITASDKPASDLYDTDVIFEYPESTAKSDNSFFDGLYYPVFNSDTYGWHDYTESTTIQGLDLNNHTIAFWVKTSAASDLEMPEVTLIVQTSDTVNSLTERIYTVITASDSTYYPGVIRTYSDGVGSWNQSVVFSDATVSTDWVHIAVTVNSTDALMTVYVNGVGIGAALGSDVIIPTTDTYKIYYCIAGRNNGSMGHLAIWDKVLSSDEIFGLYQMSEFSFDATIAIAHQAPLIYYQMGAKSSVTNAVYSEASRAQTYTWAQLELGYKPALPRYMFNGRIASMEVPVGRFGERKTIIEAVDWLDDASNVIVSGVPTMVGYTADQVLQTMLLYSGVNPTMYDFDVGQTLSYSWGSSSGQNSLYSELKRIAQSEPGYIYMRSGAGSDGEIGGVLQFESKSARFEKTTTDAALGDDVMSDAPYDIKTSRDIARLVNSVEVTVHPVEIDTVAVPIYTLSTDQSITIPAYGETTLSVKYADTDEAYELIGAVEVEQPERNVDFTINSSSDGLGNDASQDMRAVIAAMESANLISYIIGYEKNGYIMSDYKKPSSSSGVVSTTTGGTTSTTTSVGYTTAGTFVAVPKLID